jgi:hypothetical protein
VRGGGGGGSILKIGTLDASNKFESQIKFAAVGWLLPRLLRRGAFSISGPLSFPAKY